MDEQVLTISQPIDIKVPLFQHQLASIYKMEQRETEKTIITHDGVIETNLGVNADKTGYGKTLSMVTLIYRDKMQWDLTTLYTRSDITTFAGGRIKKTRITEYEKLDVTLVLTSQSIINQWYDECMKTPVCVTMITSRKQVDSVFVENYDVVLVTPTMYNRLIMKYSNMAWKRFIFDEPGHLRVPSMKEIIAGFIWLVTATPNAIIPTHKQCRRSFMCDIISHVGYCPFTVHFDYMIVKNDDEFIKNSFSMPPTNHLYHKCYSPIFKTVKGFVTENISEMISAGNIQGAITALGGDETQNITELVKEKKTEELEELQSRLKVLLVRNKKKKQIETIREKIVRLNNQLKELNNRFSEILKGDCSICFSSITKPVMEPNCQNIFCGECLLKWLKDNNTCPLCRENINTEKLMYINVDGKKSRSFKQNNKSIKTKINTVISLINEKKDGKFIIFSAWDKTFAPIRTQLNSNNIGFIEIKGSVEHRKKNIESFKDGNIKVIFLNSRFDGAGINLQEATDIIVYHKMGESTLNQIIGRANRLGRIEPLHVHHLQI